MTDEAGWRPIAPPRASPAGSSKVQPFSRLAAAHVVSVSGDALVAISLAGSLFFSLDPSGARSRIALYLLFTMAPFAVVAPLIGPAMDRAQGGYRIVVVATAALRALVAAVMVRHVSGESWWLFLEAFVMLVLSKTYSVAKAALVPGTVGGDQELVEANSKLQLLSGLSGALAAIPGGLLLLLIGPSVVVGVAAVVFAVGVVAAMRIAPAVVASEPAGDAERAELRSGGIVLAASAMGILRGLVGFVTFLLAFELRGDTEPPPLGASAGRALGSSLRQLVLEVPPVASDAPPSWYFGVVLVASVVGGLVGAALAPQLRATHPEEGILAGSLVVTLVVGLFASVAAGLAAMVMLSFAVGLAASAGKQAFDALVQRDAPDANRGRSFARFESRFQLIWVLGAFSPVIVPIPMRVGGLAVAAVSGFGAASYAVGRRALLSGKQARPSVLSRLPMPRVGWTGVGAALRSLLRVGPAPPGQPIAVPDGPQLPPDGERRDPTEIAPPEVAPTAVGPAGRPQDPPVVPPGATLRPPFPTPSQDATVVAANPAAVGPAQRSTQGPAAPSSDGSAVQPTLPFDDHEAEASVSRVAADEVFTAEVFGGGGVGRVDEDGPDLTWHPEERDV